jgi:glycosidase
MKQWIHQAINYQINLRAMAAREPRNPFEAMQENPVPSSPLAYVTGHMEALCELGVSVLHLMPPFAIGSKERKGIGSPYAVQDYRAINPEFGTEAELAAFVRKAHETGFKVIIGMVPNHTSPDNVWVAEHPEYYVQDEAGRITYDLDWSDTSKLNYQQPGLRKAMLEIYDYWLSFLGTNANGQPDGVDGFRIDMAHFINAPDFWDEALPALKARHPERELLFMAECYGAENNKGLFQRGMNAAYDDDFYKVLLYGYARDHQGRSIVALDIEEAKHNHDFRDKLAAFKTEGLAAAVELCLQDYEQNARPGPGAPCLGRYTDNHDEGRGVYRFGEGAVKAMMQVAFLAPHTIPFLLCGQEFGADNRPPIHERIQPCDKGYRVVVGESTYRREGVEFEGNLFARGIEKRQEWFQFYQTWIRLRQNNPALTDGDFRLLDVGEVCPAGQRHVIAFERSYAGTTLRCAVNLGHEKRRLKQADRLRGTPLAGECVNDELAPFSACVCRA